ncbi:hypothetical protein JCM21714_4481 [Gracilibacillus boraciitolerans JCM 21714]|uniref:Uncharacterized protein n=2 Tax=Gracilibacillus boraciitolerans TaxID=307521 RepID=W4VPX6_9BACI|nr:hypothetical protein JCM21714_4481 [Gracilibacillus boraciitolerans JCM 21714]
MLDMGMIIVVLIPFYLETKAKDAPSLVHLLLNIKHWAPPKKRQLSTYGGLFVFIKGRDGDYVSLCQYFYHSLHI